MSLVAKVTVEMEARGTDARVVGVVEYEVAVSERVTGSASKDGSGKVARKRWLE